MPSTMRLIAKTTLASSQASVTFSGIPQTFTDLMLVFSARQDSSDGFTSPTFIRFNGSSTGYSNRTIDAYQTTGVASLTNTYGVTSASFLAQTPTASQTASTFGNCELLIPNYAGSTNKSFSVTNVSENNATTAITWYCAALAGLWSNTEPITSLTVFAGNVGVRNFVSGSSFYLFGVTNAAGSIPGVFGVDATGGDVAITGGYKIHTFTSSGTITMNQPGWVEYLVIGGGGGGASGGGGAGGMRTGSIFLPPGPTSLIVGAGGTGKIQQNAAPYNAIGTSGSDSSMGSLVSIGGGAGGAYAGADRFGRNGGSGGGGGGLFTAETSASGGSGVAGQGNSGGTSNATVNAGAGGGGGAGAAGEAGQASRGGNGGAGLSSAISGVSVTYAGGGAGGEVSGSSGATGGAGGGGNAPANAAGGNGLVNSGGGGGGGSSDGTAAYPVGGNGGSGIVIIRYPVT